MKTKKSRLFAYAFQQNFKGFSAKKDQLCSRSIHRGEVKKLIKFIYLVIATIYQDTLI